MPGADEGFFVPALIIVDFQNDFCPPDGTLAVQGGRDIAHTVNALLHLPFVIKIATKDHHPQNHISFASNHSPPDNKPYETVITIRNPHNPEETKTTRLWPDHCIQGSRGSELVEELALTKVDRIIEKGQDARVEMYSAFAAPFSNPPVAVSNLATILKASRITHVFIVGLAYDYCVKCTAIDAVKQGYTTYIIKDACRPVHSGPESVTKTDEELRSAGVNIIMSDGLEVGKVRSLIE
ncbi:Pyrazinamidase/nicotinamidase [Sphaceloma murrayae]|uniref:nicotinamidase n=1 Tax=Sphaceloma murrayae TaxID=2082308 RepID=A0A2K1R0Z5_9PEZI|nr:Pyrazinamidase/nicotinamidase [Sphaceloma murrayae]